MIRHNVVWMFVALGAVLMVNCSSKNTQDTLPTAMMDADSLDTDQPSDSSRADSPSADTDHGRDDTDHELDATAVDADTFVEPRTEEALDTFFGTYGGRERFPESYVNAIETMLYSEDDIIAGDYASARARIDTLFAAQPLSDPVWWDGFEQDGTNVGSPIAYYGLRMLDEIANVGLGEMSATSETITMTVVLVGCAEGPQPATLDLREGSREVSLTLHPDVVANDHHIIRQSLRLFQHYVWAITQGHLTLAIDFKPVDTCVDLDIRIDPNYSGIANYLQPIEALPQEVRDQTDMWWVLYPSNVPSDPIFDATEFVTGGMGLRQAAPVFIIDDLWLVRKPPHLGAGLYSDVERRVYLPQWLQHEFFHHLFIRYNAFGLEVTTHQWGDRTTWPEDFVGAWEPDYYAEAFRKRLTTAEPPLWSTLRNAAPSSELLVQLPISAVLGVYNRLPVENRWHTVRIEQDENGVWWRNDANVEWKVTFENGVLRWDADSPYGALELRVELMRDADGVYLPELVGLRTPNGELYTRVGDL